MPQRQEFDNFGRRVTNVSLELHRLIERAGPQPLDEPETAFTERPVPERDFPLLAGEGGMAALLDILSLMHNNQPMNNEELTHVRALVSDALDNGVILRQAEAMSQLLPPEIRGDFIRLVEQEFMPLLNDLGRAVQNTLPRPASPEQEQESSSPGMR